MRILGIDPGYATIGFGLVTADRGQVHMGTYGTITTPAGLPLSRRLYQIDRDMEELIGKLRPDDAADALALALCRARSFTSRLPQNGDVKETI